MTVLPLLREAIQPRIDGIQRNIVMLRTFGELPFDEFRKNEILERAHYHLRLALEGVFHIASHVLSRIPGGRETEYKRMARKLGELEVVDRGFAESKLVAMAGYRNRLTHFYSEVKAEELYEISRTRLEDVETYLKAIGGLMNDPERLGLTVE